MVSDSRYTHHTRMRSWIVLLGAEALLEAIKLKMKRDEKSETK